LKFPNSIDDLTPELLTDVFQHNQPDIIISDFEIMHVAQCGDGRASTADRVILKLHFDGIVPDNQPQQDMLKTMLLSPHAPKEMYENEVRFYQQLRPELDLETPTIFASHFDSGSGQFGVIMEDLNLKQVRFPNATDEVSVAEVKGLLTTLAKLHGNFWQSKRLEQDLQWIATPLKGGMSDIFQNYGLELVKDQVEKNPFKQSLISPLGLSLEQMHQKLTEFQLDAARQPQTLLHGDSHIANTYQVPNGDGGLFDWQLLTRGCWAHDVGYIIVTALSTDLRRQHERELLLFYLDAMHQQGLKDLPTEQQAWTLYRKSIMWGLFIGWLITPPANYGLEITSANITKLVFATQDLDSFH